MDTFNLIIAILLIVLAFQFQQDWLVFGTVALLILSLRSFSTAIILLALVGILFWVGNWGDIKLLLPIILFGLLILAIIIGMKPQPKQPEYYAPDLGGMMDGF